MAAQLKPRAPAQNNPAEIKGADELQNIPANQLKGFITCMMGISLNQMMTGLKDVDSDGAVTLLSFLKKWEAFLKEETFHGYLEAFVSNLEKPLKFSNVSDRKALNEIFYSQNKTPADGLTLSIHENFIYLMHLMLEDGIDNMCLMKNEEPNPALVTLYAKLCPFKFRQVSQYDDVPSEIQMAHVMFELLLCYGFSASNEEVNLFFKGLHDAYTNLENSTQNSGFDEDEADEFQMLIEQPKKKSSKQSTVVKKPNPLFQPMTISDLEALDSEFGGMQLLHQTARPCMKPGQEITPTNFGNALREAEEDIKKRKDAICYQTSGLECLPRGCLALVFQYSNHKNDLSRATFKQRLKARKMVQFQYSAS